MLLSMKVGMDYKGIKRDLLTSRAVGRVGRSRDGRRIRVGRPVVVVSGAGAGVNGGGPVP